MHWLGALAIGATSVTAGVTSNAAVKHRMVADGYELTTPTQPLTTPVSCRNQQRIQLVGHSSNFDPLSPLILVAEAVGSRYRARIKLAEAETSLIASVTGASSTLSAAALRRA